MFKKAVSFLSLWAISATLVPSVAFALDVSDETLITSVTPSIVGGNPNEFDPHHGQALKTSVDFNEAALPALTTGYAQIKKGALVIKTLVNWTNEPLPVAIPDWDGTSAAVCGASICPAGEDYTIEVRVEFVDGADTKFDVDTAGFTLLPSVAVTGLTVAPTPFNPVNQTADVSFTTTANGFISVEILDGITLKRTLLNQASLNAGSYTKTQQPALAWNGTDSTGVIVPNKDYTVRVTTRSAANGAVLHTKTVTVTVSAPATLTLQSFVVKPQPGNEGDTFDPSPSGANEDLSATYTLSAAPDSVSLDLLNSDNEVQKNLGTFSAATGQATWDGNLLNKLVEPGVYTVRLTATKTGEPNLVSSKNVTVQYDSSNKGEIQNFTINPASFDPDFDDATISFKNTADSNITVEIWSGISVVKTFSNYQNNNFSANQLHNIVWNGQNNSGSQLSVGTYKVKVVTRNDFGAVVAQQNATINNSGGSIPNSNAHISGISFSPASTFQPAEDDELRIEFDVEQDLDSLQVLAVRGTTEIELFDEEDVEEENNVEITWGGTDDDDEYVDEGSWRIEFHSKKGASELTAAKSITVDYEQPEIVDLEISKNKFDNEQGEFTFVLFKVDADALVTIQILESNDVEDDVVEDMEVEKNKWYAVEWDGGNFNEDDDLDIKLIAENLVNEDVFDSEKISVDLAEDESTTGNKANITNDFISPVVTDGNEEMVLAYDIDEIGDVRITIHKGKTSSGSEVIELLDIEDQASGGHSVTWDGRDDNGAKLAKGFYTYKIVSKKSSSDTETGLFVVGDVGDVAGGGGSGGSDSGSSNVSPGVIVDGVLIGGGDDSGDDEPDDGSDDGGSDDDGSDDVTPSGNCVGFADVSINSKYCLAIDWVEQEGIFSGYPDGTFRENTQINRVEILKVILEAFFGGVDTTPVSGNLGFVDIQVGAWYMPYVSFGKTLGVFQGDAGKNTARPAETVNRVEALKLLFETLVVAQGYSVATCAQNYPDISAGAWYAKYVCEAKKYSLFNLVDGVNFGPAALSTRGEMAEVLYRLHLAGVI